MARVIDLFPEATGEEMVYLQNILKDMDDEKGKQSLTFIAQEERNLCSFL